MDLRLKLSKETATYCKFDDCNLCPSDRAMARKLTCVEYKLTKDMLIGMGMKRESWVCDDCIEEIDKDPTVEVVRSR